MILEGIKTPQHVNITNRAVSGPALVNVPMTVVFAAKQIEE